MSMWRKRLAAALLSSSLIFGVAACSPAEDQVENEVEDEIKEDIEREEQIEDEIEEDIEEDLTGG